MSMVLIDPDGQSDWIRVNIWSRWKRAFIVLTLYSGLVIYQLKTGQMIKRGFSIRNSSIVKIISTLNHVF